MSIIQTFYDNLAPKYDKLFQNWEETTDEQALILDKIFTECGFDKTAKLLDCACGIGTQAIGLASIGYKVIGSDISQVEIEEAKMRALKRGVDIQFENADFRALEDRFSDKFNIIIAMDNALPHMITKSDLEKAVHSIINQLADGGIFVASTRDYDAILAGKPPYSPPYIHETKKGKRVSFQTWEWNDENYKLTQYIIEDEKTLEISKFECEYRATRREELTELLISSGCSKVEWKFPEETGFYQPIVIAKK